MCEAGEREIKQCEIVTKAVTDLIETQKKNGRCSYHDGLVKDLFQVKGSALVIIALLGLLVAMTWNTNKVFKIHTELPAHPVMLERWSLEHNKLEMLEERLDFQDKRYYEFTEEGER